MSATFSFVDPSMLGSRKLPTKDARTYALQALRNFLATLVFRRPGAKSAPPVEFSIKAENIFVEWPDNVVDLPFPSIALLPSRAEYSSWSLGPPRLIEDTFNVFAPGSVLASIGDLVETVVLESWSSEIPVRRAILAGLEAVWFSREQSQALRLRLLEYFGATASFSLMDREIIDDVDSAKNLRRAHVGVEMTVPILTLVDAVTLLPYVLLSDSVLAADDVRVGTE